MGDDIACKRTLRADQRPSLRAPRSRNSLPPAVSPPPSVQLSSRARAPSLVGYISSASVLLEKGSSLFAAVRALQTRNAQSSWSIQSPIVEILYCVNSYSARDMRACARVWHAHMRACGGARARGCRVVGPAPSARVRCPPRSLPPGYTPFEYDPAETPEEMVSRMTEEIEEGVRYNRERLGDGL